MKSKKRKIVYGKSSCVEKDGIITLKQTRKLGCFRKEYTVIKKIIVSESTKEQLIALRGMEAYKYVEK